MKAVARSCVIIIIIKFIKRHKVTTTKTLVAVEDVKKPG